MPWVDGERIGAVEVEVGKRLVLAMEKDAGWTPAPLRGNDRCTTRRVEYLEGEPERMTRAELEVLEKKGLLGSGVWLSCRALVDHDVRVRPMLTVASTGAAFQDRRAVG